MSRFGKFIRILLFVLVLSSIPVTVYVVQQQTQTKSEAVFDLPISLINDSVENGMSGATVDTGGAPKITLVWPFIGKVGDAVAMYGQNFGEDPTKCVLFFGPTNIPEDHIIQWSNNRIYFTIPELPNGLLSAPITLMKVGSSSSWEKPFIIYDVSTSMQVMKPAESIMTRNIPPNYMLEIYLDDGSMLFARPETSTAVPRGRSVLSVVLKDGNGAPQPFYVEPTDFGF